VIGHQLTDPSMKKRNYKAIIDTFGEIDVLHSALESFDVGGGKNNIYHAIRHNKSYRIELLEANYQSKEFKLLVNNHSVNIKLLDDYQVLVHDMGLDARDREQLRDIVAPMPGLVLDIRCTPGDHVREGDVLVILEAMKMENALTAHCDGIVSDVKVESGVAVDKGQLLVTLE
jgi:biotin carboxyl carrier protein